MRRTTEALDQVEARLRALGRDGPTVMAGWKDACPTLAESPVTVPADVPEWIRGLGLAEQDRVLRVLVPLAQAGDEYALLAILASLRPGLLHLAAQIGAQLDDIVVEATIYLLTVRFVSRRLVAAGGLILDVRRRFWAARRRKHQQLEVCTDPDDLRTRVDRRAPDEPDVGMSSDEELAEVVVDAWRSGRLDDDEAGLIVETRVLGETVEVAGRRRALRRRLAYRLRDKAEARLIATRAA